MCERVKHVTDERDVLTALLEAAQRRAAERQERLAHLRDFVDSAQAMSQPLLEQGAPYALKRGLLNAFEVKVVVWKASHTPRWAAIVGFDTVLDDMVAFAASRQGSTVEFHVLVGEKLLRADEARAVLVDVEPVVERELRWRLTRAGRRAGRMSLVERERAWSCRQPGTAPAL